MKNKNRFLTFCWACVPGAGEMYLGYMKRGLSLMTIFWGIIMVGFALNFDAVLMMLPVVWAYAFFDTFNLRARAQEGTSEPDDYIVDLSRISSKEWNDMIRRNHTALGAVLVFIGVYAIYKQVVYRLGWSVSGVLWQIVNILPTVAIAGLLIWLGVRLMRAENDKEAEDYKAFEGTAKAVWEKIENDPPEEKNTEDTPKNDLEEW